MKFSIIVPVYNAERFVESCIQSVLSQTYLDYEMILVNDGSKDRTPEICDRYAQTYNNIFVYHQENHGQLYTRKFAISKASGDYVVFLDADDTLKPEALQVICEKICQYDSDLVIYGYDKVWEGRVLSTEKGPFVKDTLVQDKRELYKYAFVDQKYNAMWRKAVKRNLFTEEDFSAYYHLRHAEDLLHSVQLFHGCSRPVFVPQALYNYVENPSSVTHTIRYEKYKVDYTVYEYIYDFLKSSNVFHEEDFMLYRSACIRNMAEQIQIIAEFDTSYANIVDLYQSIKNTRLFQVLLKCGSYSREIAGKKWFLFALFKNDAYGLIRMIAKVVQLVRKLRSHI